jgi:hypothetical protein
MGTPPFDDMIDGVDVIDIVNLSEKNNHYFHCFNGK